MHFVKWQITVTVCLIATISIALYSRSEKTLQEELGFTIQTLSDLSVSGFRTERQISIFLDKNNYSKDNLERLFRWYLRNTANKEVVVGIQVFTSVDRYKSSKNLGVGRKAYDPFAPPPQKNVPITSYDAICFKESKGLIDGGFEHAWFIYSPDLNAPNEKKTVILKGIDPYALKHVIETFDTSSKSFKVRVVTYKLHNVEPPGVYYTLSMSKVDLGTWNEVISSHFNDSTNILSKQIHFITDEICYAFFDFIYLVTTDGGKTWSGWNAEENLAGWKDGNPRFIRDVQLSLGGVGEMTLYSKSDEILILRTEDYGLHWNIR